MKTSPFEIWRIFFNTHDMTVSSGVGSPPFISLTLYLHLYMFCVVYISDIDEDRTNQDIFKWRGKLTTFIHSNSSTLIRAGSLLIDLQLDWSWPPLVCFFVSATVSPRHANKTAATPPPPPPPTTTTAPVFYQSLQKATFHPFCGGPALFAQEYKTRFETALQEGVLVTGDYTQQDHRNDPDVLRLLYIYIYPCHHSHS